MKLRRMIAAGTLLISVQYLGLTVFEGALLVPELGVLVLVVGYRRLTTLELAAAAIFFGYLGDIYGAAEKGSILGGYVVAAAALSALARVDFSSNSAQAVAALGAGLLGFHGAVALIAAPVVIRQWLGVVLVQMVSGLAVLLVHAWAQRVWRPG